MQDKVYCYPDSNVLINKLNIRDDKELFEAEKALTFIRLQELQNVPIDGDFDFKHLLKIHEYIFQDVYEWAGKVRTVEIGKGNLFCTTKYLADYAKAVFSRFYKECYANKDSKEAFIKVLAENYGDLNALHPFKEGNGRTQREFARLVCLKCGYILDLSATTHKEMLSASIESFDTGNSEGLHSIFSKTVFKEDEYAGDAEGFLRILSSDDMAIENAEDYYNYYSCDDDQAKIQKYDAYYEEKVAKSRTD